MCVKIVKASQEIPYDASKPLEEQIAGCEQILVNYEPSDKSVDLLLEEVRRLARTGIDAKLTVKVVHNNYLAGYKAKKNLHKAFKDLALNDIIKMIVLTQHEIDKKLTELANACLSK